MKKLTVLCPDEETKEAVYDTFKRLSEMMALSHAFTDFIAKQDDALPEAELAAIICPRIFTFVEMFGGIYPSPDLMKIDMDTLSNVYDNLNFRKEG